VRVERCGERPPEQGAPAEAGLTSAEPSEGVALERQALTAACRRRGWRPLAPVEWAGLSAEQRPPAGLEETLRAASVDTCQALVVVSTDDGANLRAALNARSFDADLRVVLRLFDGDFAERIQQAFGIGISRSVSYLAAPAFAAALLDRAVIATIPVGRHALLVTEVPVGAGSPLDGRPLAAVARPGEVRLLAHSRAGQRTDWSADPRMVIQAGDRLTVVARRAGLTALLRETTSISPEPAGTPTPRQPEE